MTGWMGVAVLQVVAFYVEQAKANNHSVREAACACMAELMAKVRFQDCFFFFSAAGAFWGTSGACVGDAAWSTL